MEIVLLVSLALVPLLVPPDPTPSVRRTRTWSRNLECERVSAETASHQYPGQIVIPQSRGDEIERSAVICRQRLTRPGLRGAHDDAILSSLDASATELATAAESLHPDLAGRTWLVEAYYPSPPVAAKISFAAKNALMGRGLTVSDRRPSLAAADIDVITRLDPDEAFPAACRRYAATGTLGDDDALLAVISRDSRETILHAGLCTRGQWTWLE